MNFQIPDIVKGMVAGVKKLAKIPNSNYQSQNTSRDYKSRKKMGKHRPLGKLDVGSGV
jgi:hypothetical protein